MFLHVLFLITALKECLIFNLAIAKKSLAELLVTVFWGTIKVKLIFNEYLTFT